MADLKLRPMEDAPRDGTDSIATFQDRIEELRETVYPIMREFVSEGHERERGLPIAMMDVLIDEQQARIAELEAEVARLQDAELIAWGLATRHIYRAGPYMDGTSWRLTLDGHVIPLRGTMESVELTDQAREVLRKGKGDGK